MRQKANTPEPKIIISAERSEGDVRNHSITPEPSSSKAGPAKIIVAKGAM